MRTPSRNIRLSDERWSAFKDLLGMDWLKKQIDKAIAKDQRKPSGTTEYLLSSEANRARLMESIAQHKASKDA